MQVKQFGDFIGCDGTSFGAQAYQCREVADASMKFCEKDEGCRCITWWIDEQTARLPFLGGEANGVNNGGDLGFQGFNLVDLDRDGAYLVNRSMSKRFDLRSLLFREKKMGEVLG